MAKDVIYDSMNTQVWYEGDKSTGTRTSQQVYGKHYKKFPNNSQARAYAIRLGKELHAKVYDKYFGEYLKEHEKSESHKEERKEHHDPTSMEEYIKKHSGGIW